MLDKNDQFSHDATLSTSQRNAKVQAGFLMVKALIREAARHAQGAHETLAYLADLLTTSQEEIRDPGLALEFAEKAFESNPTHGMVQQSLGWARYRAGDWQGCIDLLEKQESYPSAGDFFAAMAHWRLGDEAKAREVFGRADRWLPGYEKRCEQRSKEGTTTYPPPAMLRRIRAEAAALLAVEASGAEAKPSPAATQANQPSQP